MEQGLIYCVDDEPEILQLYRSILEPAGQVVELISRGVEAVGRIRQRQPDLVILDEKMSDLSGMAICVRLRNDPNLPFIPLIMVTGVDSKEGKIASLEAGIDDYILKPFDPDELLARVHVMLRIKRLYEELRRTRADLFQAEKLAVFGKLAAAMAHEIRNPLSIIGASVQFLHGKLAQDEGARRTIETVLRKISEIDSTIRELLAVARPLKLQHKPLDLNHSVREAVTFIQDKCRSQEIFLELALDPKLPGMLGDEEYLQRAMLNLFLNSIHSMPDGGRLTVGTHRDASAGTVALEVRDTGAGISGEDLQRIFEPFFGRRPGGTGLGLFVVKMIVEEHRGRIEVDSQTGRGTAVTLSFPVNEAGKSFKSAHAVPDTQSTGERSA